MGGLTGGVENRNQLTISELTKNTGGLEIKWRMKNEEWRMKNSQLGHYLLFNTHNTKH